MSGKRFSDQPRTVLETQNAPLHSRTIPARTRPAKPPPPARAVLPLLFALAVAVLAPWAPGGATLGAQVEDEPELSLAFSVLAWEPVEQGIRFAPRGEAGPSEQIRLSSESRSPEYRYRGPRELTFFREWTDSEGETVRDPVASVGLRPGLRRAFLLFFPVDASGGEERYRILVLDDTREAFPPGSYRFFNLTDHRIAGRIGDRDFVLPPQKNKVARPDTESGRNISVQFAVKNPDGWQRKVSTAWFHRDTARNIVFLARDGERLAIRSIPQYQIPEKEGSSDD